MLTVTKQTEVTMYLRDYLGPNGKYPYELLHQRMEQYHKEGFKVCLISVPGSLMGINSQPAYKGRIWSDAHGTYYKTAKDLLSCKHGLQVW